MEIILIGLLAVAGVLGLLIGFVKGFTRVNSWGVEYVLTAVVVILLGGVLGKSDLKQFAGIVMFGIAVILLLVFKIVFAAIRGGLRRRKKRRLKKLYGDDFDAFETEVTAGAHADDDGMNDTMAEDDGMNDSMDDDGMNDSMYADDDGMNDTMEGHEATAALSGGNSKTSKKLRKQREKALKKSEKGACGFIDRLIGAIALAIKGVVIVGLLFGVLLVLVDLVQIKALTDAFSGLLSGGIWSFIKPHIMDLFVIAILFLCVKSGYSSGFSQALWSLILLALVVGAGFASWNLAFRVEAFVNVAGTFAEKLSRIDALNKLQEMLPVLSTLNIAKTIIMLGLFVLLIVVVVLLKIFVPRMLFWARDSKIVYVVDGVFGALFAAVIVFGVLMAIGHVIQPLSDMEIMAPFTAYFKNSAIANYLYTNNILTAFGVPELPIKNWLV